MRRRRLRSCGILKRSGGDGGRRGETEDPSRLWMCEARAERKEQNRSQLRRHGAKPLRRAHILPLAAARLREEAVRWSAVCDATRLLGGYEEQEGGGSAKVVL